MASEPVCVQPNDVNHRVLIEATRHLQRYIYGPSVRLLIEVQVGVGELRFISVARAEVRPAADDGVTG